MSGPSADRFRAERRRILDEGNEAQAHAQRLDESDDDQDFEAAWDYRDVRNAATKRYRELLPEVTVSRCPHTGELLMWAMDTVDLDGWFWEYEPSVRRDLDLPKTYLTMTGAMRLQEPVTPAPFMAIPGPAVPYVVPRILNQPETLAVIAQVPIGAHTGWPITYFGPRRTGIALENEWGTHQYQVYDHDGTWRGWNTTTPSEDDYDFELEPWIHSGKLRWIAPGDPSMTLRQGLHECPYVGLEGPRRLAFVEKGTARYPY